MKSYLSLIPISAKIHKRQNRMILFCIVLAVFLVTSLFSMADMGGRMEKNRILKIHGNWHIMLQNISADKAEQIISSSDVSVSSMYDTINYNIDGNYKIKNKSTAICGTEETLITHIMPCLTEGSYPEYDNEVLLSDNAKDSLDVKIGDNVTLNTPNKSIDYKISGFIDVRSAKTYDGIVLVTDISSFNKTFDVTSKNNVYYIQFKQKTNIRNAIDNIKAQYSLTDENVSENTALLGITGHSSNSYMIGLYIVAAILCVLIIAAGVLMITGSLNSNIAMRTQFFGMLRCIGASKQQIMRFVRLESLYWCKSAVPIGVGGGVIFTWALCGILRFGIRGEFTEIPVFEVSAIGIICGAVIGVITVLIAAQSPASHAAKVSPVSAVMGNEKSTGQIRFSVSTKFSKIENALGFHHAISARKNLFLMISSFALSIILFLSFSVVLVFLHHALNPLRPYAPDISILSNDHSCSVKKELIDEICSKEGVERVFGRMFKGEIPVQSNTAVNKIDLISYEELQLNWAENDVLMGDVSKVLGDSNYVITVYDKSNSFTVGDKINLGSEELEVACILSDSPFDSTDIPTVICSEQTFTRLTGEQNYSVIDIQLNQSVTDETVKSIHNMVGENESFHDRQETNRETIAVYLAFSLLVYGFLAIIAMITIFYIINSISMSVSAKIKQYGAMRAVGMDGGQITRMIASEAITYAFFGSIVGCVFGLPLNRFLFKMMITNYWGDGWSVPYAYVAVILIIVSISCVVAVYAPSKRIKNMAITDTINEL